MVDLENYTSDEVAAAIHAAFDNWTEFYTPVSLKLLLKEKVLTDRWHLPSPAGLRQLAIQLNVLHNVVLRNKGPRAERLIRHERITDALATLRKELPTFVLPLQMTVRLSTRKNELRGLGPSLRYYLSVERYLSVLDALIVAAQNADPVVAILKPTNARSDHWKDYAEDIAEYFIDAMQATNPGKRIGNSANGPLSRFVSVVVPSITDESVKPETVFAHFKALAKRQ